MQTNVVLHKDPLGNANLEYLSATVDVVDTPVGKLGGVSEGVSCWVPRSSPEAKRRSTGLNSDLRDLPSADRKRRQ